MGTGGEGEGGNSSTGDGKRKRAGSVILQCQEPGDEGGNSVG